jgi:transposase-like protein
MSDFKWRHYAGEIILQCVRWYCKYGISYRDLEEMMRERGIEVDHTTLYRWVQTYAPEMEKRLRWYRQCHFSGSWRVDETYVKVKGEWKYLYRAVTSEGRTIEFYLSHTRNITAAKIFLKKALRGIKEWSHPHTITTDKNPTYGAAIDQLNQERGGEQQPIRHRMAKHLNNVIEADHGKLKRLIKPTLGFKSMKTAYATIKGFEVMRMFRKGQFNTWFRDNPPLTGEIGLINRQFGICAI